MSDVRHSLPVMRTLLGLLLLVAGPAFGQSASHTDRSSTLPSFVRHAASAETAQPVAAVYSWVDEADGRFVAAPHDSYLTPEERTAWAAGEDAPARFRAPLRVVVAAQRATSTPIVACEVLKCLHPEALSVATTTEAAVIEPPPVIG